MSELDTTISQLIVRTRLYKELRKCPAEIGALEGFDPRMTAMHRDVLIHPAVARAVSDTQFAVTRMKVGLEATVATIRKLTGIKQPWPDAFRHST
jgi:hypothetical protein